MGIPDFESSAFGHSANLPKANAKVIKSIINGRVYNIKLRMINNIRGITTNKKSRMEGVVE